MNAVVSIKERQPALPTVAMSEGELLDVLQSSIYPGAKLESIKLALGYCKAGGLDPLQKPVHIVPMNVKVRGRNGERDTYEWRDVIMPGINLHRTNASRTGEYAGSSEPEFGPDLTRTFVKGDRELAVTFPEWCKVTVFRLLPNGQVAAFTAKEYWLENYATAGNDTNMPNAMWARRVKGQLAKCTEAQALRKAFPEHAGAPTAEEMEGRTIHGDTDLERQALEGMVDPAVLQAWILKAQAATTDEDAQHVYRDGIAAMGTKDLTSAATFKKAVIERRTALKNAQATDATPRQPAEQKVAGEEPQQAQVPVEQPSAAAQQGDPFTVTYAKVADMMKSAAAKRDQDALDIAADWIDTLPEAQRSEARALYEQFSAEIKGGAK